MKTAYLEALYVCFNCDLFGEYNHYIELSQLKGFHRISGIRQIRHIFNMLPDTGEKHDNRPDSQIINTIQEDVPFSFLIYR